jgi:hypothetical protein
MEGLYADKDSGEDIRAVINGIESVSVQEGRIVIRPRRRRGDDAAAAVVMEEHDFFAVMEEPSKPMPYAMVYDDDIEYVEDESADEPSEVEYADEREESDDAVTIMTDDSHHENAPWAEEEEEDPYNGATTNPSMVRGTNIEPAHPKQDVLLDEDAVEDSWDEEEEEEEEDPDNSATTSMLRATKIEPARPKQAVVTTSLRATQSSP